MTGVTGMGFYFLTILFILVTLLSQLNFTISQGGSRIGIGVEVVGGGGGGGQDFGRVWIAPVTLSLRTERSNQGLYCLPLIQQF